MIDKKNTVERRERIRVIQKRGSDKLSGQGERRAAV